ncbi:hypothetical protein [Bartonella heixiaziensis]|uniref:hypothetical protein n=1 Tax=Bartonella heixiaziensis TaxID=1461000 RepID=UPI003D20F46A
MQCASHVALNGLKRTAEFSVIAINVIGVSKAFFQVSREEDISFIAGLDDAETFVAGLRKTQPCWGFISFLFC